MTAHAPRCALVLAVLSLAACAGEAPSAPAGRLAIDVAPLNLSGITNADYTLTVTNGPGGGGDTVWTRAISSQQYGDGAGSLSYVGTCDATTGVNTVSLTLTALYDVASEVPVGTYLNPTPITREIACVENADVAVTFDITLARQADQGFFDVAVQFQDIFCSAKLDCQRPDGGDLELLHTADGARDMTVVMGFACTGSLTGTTFLYLDDLVIDCSGQVQDVRVAPVGLGNVTPTANPGGYLFGAAVYRGVEGFASKAYWNVSLGLNAAAFKTSGTCTLRTRGTASAEPFPQQAGGFPLPAGSVYPVIDWEVVLSDDAGVAGRRVCTTHQVNGADGGVATSYLGYLPLLNGFTWSPDPIYLQHRFQPVHPSSASGQVLSAGAPICNPSCERGVCVAQGVGTACDCTGTGYGGDTCATPVCNAICLNGGVCDAPEHCDCADTGYGGATCASDVDECASDAHGCDPNATCTNTDGAFTCACNAGYEGDGTSCADPDGCDAAPCFVGVDCADVPAPGTGYVCDACPASMWGDGESCTACAAVAHCAGALTCASDSDSHCDACDAGYTQLADGLACTDVDGCALDPCAPGVTCTDVAAPGTGRTCGACPSGQWGDGATCTACADVTHCAVAETCSTGADSACATCDAGYTQLTAGAACTDSDGCALTPCAAGVTCTDVAAPGTGRTCGACPSGQYGDGATCTACAEIPHCAVAETCSTGADSACATCDDGYTQLSAGAACTDIDECGVDNGGCDSHATCTNTPGGRTCACDAFWTGDGLTCADIDECSTSNGACGSSTYITCTNNTGAAPTCTDKNECLTNNGGCGAPAAWTCTNNYAAAVTCTDRDECALGTHDCGDGATCTNTTGSFTCACGAGGIDGSGGAGTSCTYRTDCLALHLAAPSLIDGVYTIDPDGVGGQAAFPVYCDMTSEGGGWTLAYTSSDDGVTTFTWNARALLTTDTTTVGAPTLPGRDLKSLALHRLPFTALLFNHEPSGDWAMYGVKTAATNLGAHLGSISDPQCPAAKSSGLGMLAGTLTVAASGSGLCDTDLYFHLGDREGGDVTVAACLARSSGSSQDTYGPGWNIRNNSGNAACAFDDPSYGGTGPQYGAGTTETNYRGFGWALGLNTGAAGTGANYLQVFVRDYPLESCLAWLKAGATANGTYTVDPDGPEGAVAPFSVTCDMTTEGGGWTAIPYAADLAYGQHFTGGDAWRWLPANFTLGLSTAQINAIRAVSSEGRQTYVGRCDGIIHYIYYPSNVYEYAFGFRFQTGVETSAGLATWTPHAITVLQDGCKTNGGEGGALAKATTFDIRSPLVPVINVYSRDNGDTGEYFGSPLTTNPAYLR
ncbi:MAG: hypothetical protein CVU56_00515 [Deltaproteobacteria bacterium HGW-Deltaproteobacteria-14]|jgi:hypothetical protein|nr:MAG: hypothetical protein CVU56_00515 [Deltaproteobacteria bacterium HGW-Deltaproteobacteria-14]